MINKFYIMKKLRWLFNLIVVSVICASFVSCSNDDEDDLESSSNGKVKVTNIVQGKKSGSHYSYKITVQYSGSADDVKQLGFEYGKGSSMVGGGTKSKTGAVKSYTGSVDFYTGQTYYVQPFVKTKSGKTYGSKVSAGYIR